MWDMPNKHAAEERAEGLDYIDDKRSPEEDLRCAQEVQKMIQQR
jgi:hypothetical protein